MLGVRWWMESLDPYKAVNPGQNVADLTQPSASRPSSAAHKNHTSSPGSSSSSPSMHNPVPWHRGTGGAPAASSLAYHGGLREGGDASAQWGAVRAAGSAYIEEGIARGESELKQALTDAFSVWWEEGEWKEAGVPIVDVGALCDLLRDSALR